MGKSERVRPDTNMSGRKAKPRKIAVDPADGKTRRHDGERLCRNRRGVEWPC